jgi:hypothetical protein
MWFIFVEFNQTISQWVETQKQYYVKSKQIRGNFGIVDLQYWLNIMSQ